MFSLHTTMNSNTNTQKSTAGFTLLELSIVLIIIALIAGSIITGKSMIRSAELQSVIKEYDSYLKAVQEFNTKYGQLPGDYAGATTIWGSLASCAVYVAPPPSNYTTCNGDGNGRVGASTNAGVLSSSSEWWLVWAHLSNAGLIDGRYTGALSSNSTVGEAEINTNVPASKFKGGGWTMFYMQQIADSTSLWGEATGGYGHMLSFGSAVTASYTNGGIMTPADALDIEKKMDDGRPGKGNIRAWRTGYLSNCTENDTSSTAQTYKTSTGLRTCSLLFILGL